MEWFWLKPAYKIMKTKSDSGDRSTSIRLMKTMNAHDQWFPGAQCWWLRAASSWLRGGRRRTSERDSGPCSSVEKLHFYLFHHTLRMCVYHFFLRLQKKKILKTTAIYICCFQAHKENWNQDIWDNKGSKLLEELSVFFSLN